MTVKHAKFDFIKSLIAEGMPVMLEGEAGSGKTTVLMQIAEALGLPFYSITGTQQTSVANLLGFKDVNGNYSSTQLREAYEHGGLFLMDEYDGFNPNTILAMNSVENGFISFPDKVVHAHPDFRLVATVNPSNQHAAFTGRSKQDAAALDRYINIPMDRDPHLELKLTSEVAVAYANKMRDLLHDNGVVSRVITMRDTMRFHKLQELSDKGVIQENPLDTLVGKNEELKDKLYAYAETVAALSIPLSSTGNTADLYSLIKKKRGT